MARGINEAGQVVGDARTRRGYNRAFVYSGGVMRDITGKDFSTAYDINNMGQVVGVLNSRPFSYSLATGVTTLLTGLANKTSEAYALAVNDNGLVAGWATGADGKRHGVYWLNGKIYTLPKLTATGSTA
jgi:probable HAF family extracellular repeat protein